MDFVPDTVIDRLLRELAEEQNDLLGVVQNLGADSFNLPTPAIGWDLGDQIVHLAFFDRVASQAIAHGEEFAQMAQALEADPHHFGHSIRMLRALPCPEMLAEFKAARDEFIEVARAHPGKSIQWFGPPMKTESMVTARLMETFAHGVDIRDALNEPLTVAARHLDVVYLGYRTVAYSFLLHGLAKPEGDIEIEVKMPDHSIINVGVATIDEHGEENRISGSLGDLALLVVQRRNRHDLDLVVTGSFARAWVEIAQAYAGPPGEGRHSLKTS